MLDFGAGKVPEKEIRGVDSLVAVVLAQDAQSLKERNHWHIGYKKSLGPIAI